MPELNYAPSSHLSVSGLCSKVWSTTISVYSHVCLEISLQSCLKCKSVQSILQKMTYVDSLLASICLWAL